MNCKPEFGFEKKDRPMDQTDLTVYPKETMCSEMEGLCILLKRLNYHGLSLLRHSVLRKCKYKFDNLVHCC